MDNLNTLGIRKISKRNKEYPDCFKHLANPPSSFFLKGVLRQSKYSLAIVGRRRASQESLAFANKVAYKLANAGVTIISGMATGVDSAAHQGALKAGGYTIAVLGSGLDICYPFYNLKIFKQIEETGCLMSEYPPGTRPYPANFPRRNRLISSLAESCLIVEASLKSGTMITANFAAEQGKDVLVVPGAFGASSWQGSNQLIKDGAIVVTSVEDIADHFNIKLEKDTINITADEKNVLEQLKEAQLDIDQLVAKTKYKVYEISQLLITLEIKGLVRKDLSNRYFVV
ncbi:MAG: DNA-protecting protein DprA [Actinobacteria bacterium]|nr:MAG: DNA-protecting protein DprA [Actinomycetota bacterium]